MKPLDEKYSEILALEDVERRQIEYVLGETKFNLSLSARILKIDRTTLYNKLKKYGLHRNVKEPVPVEQV